MTPKELSQRLAENAESVCRHLYSAGKKQGQEWRVGSLDGEAGQSLGIHLTGNKAGVWSDFATGESGDLLGLWQKARGLSLSEALKEAKSFLGIYDPSFYGTTKKTYKKPVKPKCRTPKEGNPVYEYLTEKRKLTPKTIKAYQIGDGGDAIIFPSMRDDVPVMIKRLLLKRKDGKKDIRPTSKDQEPSLFGWQAIPDDARAVTITEGEIDAMSAYQFGFPALSVPFGGGKGAKHNWIETEYDNLERFDTIYLCFDMDKEGRDAVHEVSERLGNHRCKVVTLPAKDMNVCLQDGYDVSDIERCYKDAKTLDPSELKPATHFNEDVIKEFYPPEDWREGFSTPWQKVSEKLIFRPAEVSVISGVNGHGKSEGVGHLTLEAISQGEKACIASLEFNPRKWLYRITRQASGVDLASIPYIKEIQKWFADKLWVFDVVGTAKSNRIINVFIYARRRYGITLFIIDNLSKLDIGLDNYDAQRDFVDRLTDFAKEHESHVILVAHNRKGADDSKIGGKMDIKGTGAIGDLADTLLIWWRNRPKEEKIRQAGETLSQNILDQPDAYVRCEKQRNGDDEPLIALWFDRESHQFLESGNDRPKQYVEFEIKRRENV
jgi:twinkle protein